MTRAVARWGAEARAARCARACGACLTAIFAALGCSLDPLPVCGAPGAPATDDCPCGPARRISGGGCCEHWTRADEQGRCAPREWALPSADEGIGDPGARSIEVAIDGLGRAVAVWLVASADGAVRLVAAEDQSSPIWSLHEPASALELSAGFPDVAAGADGSAIASWRQGGDEGAIFAALRAPSGRWTDPGSPADALSFAPSAYEPRAAIAPDGRTVLVWNQWTSTGYGVAVATRSPGDETWKLPTSADDVLSPPVFYSNAPQIALAPNGDALVTWYQSNGGPLMVYVSERRGWDAPFSRPGLDDFLSAPGAPVDSHPIGNPMPALGPSGEAAIVWTQEDGAGSTPVYIATRDAKGAWTRPADRADSFSPRAGVARCPQVAFGPAGDLFVVWYQGDGSNDAVYAARRAPDGRWIDPGTAPLRLSSEGALGITPSLAVGPDGSVIVAWSEQLEGSPFRVAVRRASQDVATWGPIEILSPDGAGDALTPSASIGGQQDRTLVGWVQGSLLDARVFFARVD